MDKNGKSRHSVWLSDDVWQEVDAFYKLDNPHFSLVCRILGGHAVFRFLLVGTIL